MLDPVSNFAKATLTSGIASGATSLTVGSGEGAKFPQPSTDGAFNITIWNSTDYPDPSDDPNREICRCTARSTDTFTITRAQEGTTDVNHNTDGKVYKITLSFTKKMKDDIGARLDTPPTETKLTVASKGGVFNGGFEIAPAFTAATNTNNRWIDGTAGGSTTDDRYGWFTSMSGTASAMFNSSVAYSGKYSLKLSTSATGSYIEAYTGDVSVYGRSTKTMIAIKPSTTYKCSVRMKTNYVSGDATNGAFISFRQYTSAGVGSTETTTTVIKTTTDWTYYSVTFTTGASNYLMQIRPTIYGHQGTATLIMDAWFDDIKIEELSSPTTSITIPQKAKVNIQAITSTDNIDQSLDPTGAYTNTYALTNAVNEGATHLQTFTPTKKYTTQIGVWPIAKGTGNWTLVVHDASNVVVASKTIANASVTEGAMLYFDVPNIWTSGALHFHLYSSVADGTCKANTSNDLETASYIQRYAKKSEYATLVLNGIKTELKADGDGILSNAVIDLDNGKYRYYADYSTAGSYSVLSDFFSADAGSAPSYTEIVVNNYKRYGFGLDVGSSASPHQVIKVKTVAPIKSLIIGSAFYFLNRSKVQISLNNVDYTDLFTVTSQQGALLDYANTSIANGYSEFYIRFYSVSAQTLIRKLSIEADLDTSKIPTGLLYPLSTNQFSETVKLPSTVDRIYYRLNKYTNENGVVMPALELCSTTTVVGYIPLRIDNSQETNPAVAIVKASTTNGQASGTGSDEGNNYILNDGEYMTLSSATDELTVAFLVGKGTTAFTNITKNIIYMSSDGASSDATQDPSHQATFTIGIPQQGVVESVTDVKEELQNVRKDMVKSSSWTEWTPTLTWTTGTPEGSVVTKARYKIVDGICHFSFYYSATDGNGATALTISLPVLPKDNDSLTALQAQELSDTTWSNPLAYIDDGGTSIAFRSLTTIADTKAVKVLVTGSYEI